MGYSLISELFLRTMLPNLNHSLTVQENLYSQNLYSQNLYTQNLYTQNLYSQNPIITWISAQLKLTPRLLHIQIQIHSEKNRLEVSTMPVNTSNPAGLGADEPAPPDSATNEPSAGSKLGSGLGSINLSANNSTDGSNNDGTSPPDDSEPPFNAAKVNANAGYTPPVTPNMVNRDTASESWVPGKLNIPNGSSNNNSSSSNAAGTAGGNAAGGAAGQRGGSNFDLDQWINQLLNYQPLTEENIRVLCDKAKESLHDQKNVVTVRWGDSIFIHYLIIVLGKIFWISYNNRFLGYRGDWTIELRDYGVNKKCSAKNCN
jgi:hypothetical protein